MSTHRVKGLNDEYIQEITTTDMLKKRLGSKIEIYGLEKCGSNPKLLLNVSRKDCYDTIRYDSRV